MRDEHAEAALAQLAGGGAEVGSDAVKGGLDEYPAPLRRTLGEQLQLALAHASDHLVAQLTPAADVELDPLAGQREAQLQDARVDLDGVGQAQVGADVRGRNHRGRAVGHRRAGELQAGGQVVRTVVDIGQQVEVEVDVGHLTCSIGLGRGDLVTVL